MKKAISCIIAIIILVCSLTVSISAEKQKLVIGVTDFQPFNYYDENGILTGFDTELAYYICEKLNMEPEFVEIEWDEKLLMLNSGAIDCVWNDLVYTSERAYEMSLSDVYLTYHYYSEDDNEQIIENSVIGFKKGNSIVNQVNRFLTEAKNDGTIARLAAKYNINTTNNLVIPEKQKLVIGITDYQPFNYYDENGLLTGFDTELAYYICEKLNMEPEFVEIEWDEKLLMLNSGAIDCVWNDLAYTSERAYEMSLSDVYLSYYFFSEYDSEQMVENSVIGFKKGNSIVNQVNRFLNEAKNDGTIARLATKYNINSLNDSSVKNEIKINLNGKQLLFDQPPIIVNNRTLVPLRAIFEALNAQVIWNEETKTVISNRGSVTIRLSIGDDILYKNDVPIQLDVVAQVVNDRTMVPIRAITESFGCSVTWNEENKTVFITK